MTLLYKRVSTDGDDGGDNSGFIIFWLAKFVFVGYSFISLNCRLYIKSKFASRYLFVYDVNIVDNDSSWGSLVLY